MNYLTFELSFLAPSQGQILGPHSNVALCGPAVRVLNDAPGTIRRITVSDGISGMEAFVRTLFTPTLVNPPPPGPPQPPSVAWPQTTIPCLGGLGQVGFVLFNSNQPVTVQLDGLASGATLYVSLWGLQLP